MPDTPDHFILICSTCNGERHADRLRDTLNGALPSGFVVRAVACMAGCARPTTVGFQAAGKAQYLFGDIKTARDIEALSQFAHQYHASADGWTCATQRPRPLFRKTLSRLPRIDVKEPA